MARSKVLYADTFETVHAGHRELVGTAAAYFDHVIVATIGIEQELPPLAERAERAASAFLHLPNVEVVTCVKPIGEYARLAAVDFLVASAHSNHNVDRALQRACLNRALWDIPSLLLPTTATHWLAGSTNA